MKQPESSSRNQRILGLAGLIALGSIGCLSVLGVIIVTVHPGAIETAGDALTALSTVGAATVGALAGWFARGRFDYDPPESPPAPTARNEEEEN